MHHWWNTVLGGSVDFCVRLSEPREAVVRFEMKPLEEREPTTFELSIEVACRNGERFFVGPEVEREVLGSRMERRLRGFEEHCAPTLRLLTYEASALTQRVNGAWYRLQEAFLKRLKDALTSHLTSLVINVTNPERTSGVSGSVLKVSRQERVGRSCDIHSSF